MIAGFSFLQSVPPPIRLTLPQPALLAEVPNLHSAPRRFTDGPLPVTLLLGIGLLPVHIALSIRLRAHLGRASQRQGVSLAIFKGGKWVYRTDAEKQLEHFHGFPLQLAVPWLNARRQY